MDSLSVITRDNVPITIADALIAAITTHIPSNEKQSPRPPQEFSENANHENEPSQASSRIHMYILSTPFQAFLHTAFEPPPIAPNKDSCTNEIPLNAISWTSLQARIDGPIYFKAKSDPLDRIGPFYVHNLGTVKSNTTTVQANPIWLPTLVQQNLPTRLPQIGQAAVAASTNSQFVNTQQFRGLPPDANILDYIIEFEKGKGQIGLPEISSNQNVDIVSGPSQAASRILLQVLRTQNRAVLITTIEPSPFPLSPIKAMNVTEIPFNSIPWTTMQSSEDGPLAFQSSKCLIGPFFIHTVGYIGSANNQSSFAASKSRDSNQYNRIFELLNSVGFLADKGDAAKATKTDQESTGQQSSHEPKGSNFHDDIIDLENEPDEMVNENVYIIYEPSLADPRILMYILRTPIQAFLISSIEPPQIPLNSSIKSMTATEIPLNSFQWTSPLSRVVGPIFRQLTANQPTVGPFYIHSFGTIGSINQSSAVVPSINSYEIDGIFELFKLLVPIE